MANTDDLMGHMKAYPVKPKHKPPHEQMSVKMRRALRCKPGEVAEKMPHIVKKIKAKLLHHIPERKTKAGNKADNQNQMQIVNATAEHLAGESIPWVEEKYKLAHGTVKTALKMFFPSEEQRENALRNLLLDNAITGAMIFKKKAHSLSARDAALTAGIFTQRFSELKKAQANNYQPEIPVTMVIKLEETLARAKEIHGKILDI